MEQRFESWYNYCHLFDYILGCEEVELGLPLQWLWDMVDEFLFQFQSFSQTRCKLSNKTPHEISLLKGHPHVWSVNTVLRYLESLIQKSKIVQLLNQQATTHTDVLASPYQAEVCQDLISLAQKSTPLCLFSPNCPSLPLA